MSENQIIEIDGKQFALNTLSDEAKEQVANLQATDKEIARLQAQLGIAQTARIAYANALKAALPAE